MFLMERDILEVEFMEFQSIEIQTEKNGHKNNLKVRKHKSSRTS